MARKTELDIIIKAKNLSKIAFDSVKKQANSAKKSFKAMGESLMKAKLAIVAASAAITGFIIINKKLVESWLDEEKSLKDLNATLKTHGYNVKEARKEIDSFADSQQALTKYGDTDTRFVLQMLIDRQIDLKDAIKATSLIQDTAVATGKELEEVTKAVANANYGETGALKELGIVLDGAKVKSEGFGAVIQSLSKYEGRAAADTDNLSTKILQVSNYSGDAQEAIGQGMTAALINAATQTFNLEGGMGDLGEVVKKVTDWVGTKFAPVLTQTFTVIAEWGKMFSKTIENLSAGLKILTHPKKMILDTEFRKDSFDAFKNSWKDMQKARVDFAKTVFTAFSDEEMEKARANIKKIIDEMNLGTSQRVKKEMPQVKEIETQKVNEHDSNEQLKTDQKDLVELETQRAEQLEKQKAAQEAINEVFKEFATGLSTLDDESIAKKKEEQEQIKGIVESHKEALFNIELQKEAASIMGLEYDDLNSAVNEHKRLWMSLVEAGAPEAMIEKARDKFEKSAMESRYEKMRKKMDARHASDNAKSEADKIKEETEAPLREVAEAQAKELHSTLSSAIETAFESGGKAGIDSLKDYFKNKMMTGIADQLASAILGGGQQAGGMMGGGGGGGIGNLFSGIFGGGGEGGGEGGGGAGGLLGGLFGGPLGLALGAFGLFSSFSGGGKKAALSGTQGIFGDAPTISTTDLSTLGGSEYYQQAAFRAGNRASSMVGSRMDTGVDINVNVNSGPEFETEVQTDTVNRTRLNERGGIPARTGFSNG